MRLSFVPLCLLALVAAASAARPLQTRKMLEDAMAPVEGANMTEGDVAAKLADMQDSLCRLTGANATDDALGQAAAGAGLDIVQAVLCKDGEASSSFNLTSLVAPVEQLLARLNDSAAVSSVVEQMFSDPAAAFDNLGGLLGLGGSNVTANKSSSSLDLAALAPILKAIQNDSEAAKQLPTLLPFFLAITSGNTSALDGLDWNALLPVLKAIWNDPQARASIPTLLPYLENALGGLVGDKTGSNALGGLVSGLLGGLANLANPLLEGIFGSGGGSSGGSGGGGGGGSSMPDW